MANQGCSSDRPEQTFQQARFALLRSRMVDLLNIPNVDLSPEATHERISWLTQFLLAANDHLVVAAQESQAAIREVQAQQRFLSQQADEVHESIEWLAQSVLSLNDYSIATAQESQAAIRQVQAQQRLLSQQADEAFQWESKRLEHQLTLSDLVWEMRRQQRYILRSLMLLALSSFVLAACTGYLLMMIGDLRQQLLALG